MAGAISCKLLEISMQKIKNLKTTKSYKQKEDKIAALRAKKNFNLKNTDWTQLPDVQISNSNEVIEWRKELRNLEINDGEASERILEEVLSRMPEPIVKNSTIPQKSVIGSEKSEKLELEVVELRNELDRLKNNKAKEDEELNQEIILDEKQARSFAEEIFSEYKNKRLVDNGILEYNMMRTLLEEAIDRRISPDSHGPLLEEYLNSNENISIDDIIENCREFFKNINGLYVTFTKEQRNLYNMSLSELNNWFKENGHRYRCYYKD